MPAWLLAAMRMLGLGAASGAGFALAEGLGDRSSPSPFGAGGGVQLAGGHAPMRLDRFGHEVHRRRRRRRALTASDKADIAFIAGTLGKAAGAQFAVGLASRSR